MIETLRIEELAIVDSAALDFAPGLNVLTGETGAGKSIVLGALSLLAGGRGAARSIREGADRAVVEAVFRTAALPDLEAELAERGFEGDAHELIVRRALARNGRSRAWLAGQLAPVATLAEIFTGRLEISSQHDSQSLLRAEQQGRLLDEWAGLGADREVIAHQVAELRRLAAEVQQLQDQTREREQRRDFLAFQVKEIDEAKLDPDEVDGLQELRGRLAHADRLGRDAGVALARLQGDPQDPSVAGAADHLGEARRLLADLVTLDPGLEPIVAGLEAAGSEVSELAQDLERRLAGLEADPARLGQIESRLHQIEQLQRKYGADVTAVLAFRDQAAAELDSIEGADAQIEGLQAEAADVRSSLAERAGKLSERRAKAARKLTRAVEPLLRELAMPEARFGVSLDPAPPPEGLPCGSGGAEVPVFQISANRGEPLHPLRQVASGGELSRVFLALKQALREQGAGMVLVFDEVDAGIGGEAAERVGHRLAELAERHQVLCITHLPQIAAYADRHFRVRKQAAGKRTGVRIDVVEGDDRVAEIARMAGGARPSKAVRDYAAELLATRGER